MKEKEVWKPVREYELYYAVSSFGRVKSLARTIWKRTRKAGLVAVSYPTRILPTNKRKPRYEGDSTRFKVSLHKDNILLQCDVRLLVAEAFLGPRPSPDYFVNSRDGNSENLYASNLYWDNTRLESKRLAKADVRQIKELLEADELSNDAIAKMYGVKTISIDRIANGITWKNLD